MLLWPAPAPVSRSCPPLDVEACSAADRDESGEITIDEILAAIGRALSSCEEE